MTIKEFELRRAFCILVEKLSSWPVDDYEQARIIAYSVHSEHVERDFMQRVFGEADKRRPLLIEGVVNPERTKRIHPVRASSKTEYGQTVQADR